MTPSRNRSAPSPPSLRPSDGTAVGVIGAGSEQAAQLSAASAVLQRSLERLANLSDVRLLVSEVLTSIIEVAGADGGALLRYEPDTRTLVLQSYVLEGLVLDIANNERLAQKQEVMPAESFPHWNDILGATDTFYSCSGCGVHPALPEVVYSGVAMISAQCEETPHFLAHDVGKVHRIRCLWTVGHAVGDSTERGYIHVRLRVRQLAKVERVKYDIATTQPQSLRSPSAETPWEVADQARWGRVGRRWQASEFGRLHPTRRCTNAW